MGRHRLAVRRSISFLVRVMLAAILTVFLLDWWSTNTGRGFLPSMRRLVVLHMLPDGGGGWRLDRMQEAPDEGPDLPVLTNREALGVIVQESSMGRTSFGEYDQWRASNWYLMALSLGDGQWQPFSEIVGPVDSALDMAVSRAIERDIAPNSPPSRVWPAVPLEPRRVGPLWWIARQRRTSWGVVIVIPLACFAISCLAVVCLHGLVAGVGKPK